MAFPPDMAAPERARLAVIAFLLVAGVAAVAAIFAVLVLEGRSGTASAQTVREYFVEVVPQDVDYGGGNVWHAWTFNLVSGPEGNVIDPPGVVPGPTLEVSVGEKLVVHIENKLDIVHSFHSHMENYSLENDGSQLNIITGIGAGAMIQPGASYTYEFEPVRSGTIYYHCHSADGDHHITEHIHQGLYGAIVVHDKDEPKRANEQVIFMGEMGFDTEGNNVPPYIMNGLGLPGGEHTLEEVFMEQGIDAVTAQFNKTVPVLDAEVNEELIIHIINIGDAVHTFHVHGVKINSLEAIPGNPWPANVVSLAPGAVDTISMTFVEPALWLFHCHVVAHADAGMIGLINVADGQQPDAPATE